MRTTPTLIAAALLSVFAATSFAQTAASAPAGQAHPAHPRRAEVNHRLANQDKRIHKEVKDGEISKAQAAGLHKQVKQIHQEEHAMAAQDGGHITKQEQKTLNQQENGVSKQIGK